MADLHLVIQKANADDLVMPSKLATILSVGGVSIITSSRGIALHKMVNEFDFGYTVEPENSDLFCKKVLDIMNDTAIDIKRQNARQYAVNHLSINNIMGDFVEKVLQ